MTSFETLVRNYPNKTGAELLEIHYLEKKQEELEFQLAHEDDMVLIKDLNENGGYYRGRFGIGQYYYYRFFNVRMDTNNVIYTDCENIVIFTEENKISDRFHAELRTEQYKRLDTYSIENEERVTKKEWDEISNYLKKTTELFWPVKK